ncbi:glycerol kinase [Alicyclobacillaceae bacterium I2511]|nr:glycerol kinase [Alicyclobacillaceae bacterium I2511]
MSQKGFILAIDQGTTSSRALLFDHAGNIQSVAQMEFPQYFPHPGWVEHNPLELWNTVRQVMTEVLAKADVHADQVVAIGITNQRETTLVWDRKTGQPVYNALVWQSRQTADLCENLRLQGLEPMIQEKTGLRIDPYFSASKLQWILQTVPQAKTRAQRGELLFGTVDTWLLWQLTGGKAHGTDVSNASRTLLYNIHELTWDKELLAALDIPASLLPQVRPTAAVHGYTDPQVFFGRTVPITGIAGDQQAALFGQTCFSPGMAKNTYGTGCFLLMNTGTTPVHSSHGLLTTIAWQMGKQVEYALEGSVFVAGSAISWLRDGLEMIRTAAESDSFASQVDSTQGVYVVPAFVGLGAPYWDTAARGAMFGITRGTHKKHIVRATLESLAYQTQDVLSAMEIDADMHLQTLRVDGGGAANNFLMQFQSDLLGVPVERPQILESTARGAAYLAGLTVGFWNDPQEIAQNWRIEQTFLPQMEDTKRRTLYAGWQRAVAASRFFAHPES